MTWAFIQSAASSTRLFCVRRRHSGTICPHRTRSLAFPDLSPGDRWCVCAARWLQVQQAGAACPVVLEATHENTLKIVPFELLIQHAVIPEQLH